MPPGIVALAVITTAVLSVGVGDPINHLAHGATNRLSQSADGVDVIGINTRAHSETTRGNIGVSLGTPMRVLIDNSGHEYHSEITLSVMRLVQCLHPERSHRFYVDVRLAKGLDIDPAFDKSQMPQWEVGEAASR